MIEDRFSDVGLFEIQSGHESADNHVEIHHDREDGKKQGDDEEDRERGRLVDKAMAVHEGFKRVPQWRQQPIAHEDRDDEESDNLCQHNRDTHGIH